MGTWAWAFCTTGYPSRSFTRCRSNGTRTGDAGHAVVRVAIGGRCSSGGTGCARNAAASRGTAGGVRRHSIRETRHGLSGRLPKPESAAGRPVSSSHFRVRWLIEPAAAPGGGCAWTVPYRQLTDLGHSCHAHGLGRDTTSGTGLPLGCGTMELVEACGKRRNLRAGFDEAAEAYQRTNPGVVLPLRADLDGGGRRRR